MSSQNSALYWHQGENRIQDELQMSNLDVMTTIGSPYASLNMQDELKHAATAQGADVSILIYKTDFQNARLVVYASGSGDNAQMYSEYDFAFSDAEESAEIVALKTAEVVQQAVNGADEADPLHLPKTSRPPMAPKLKLALVLAISGAVTLGVGGVFHGLTHRYESDANRMEDYKTDRILYKSNELGDSPAKQLACKIGAVAGYSIGSFLLATSAVILSVHRHQTRETTAHAVISFRGTSFIWGF